jgi:predicted neuraminidase
MIVQPLDSAMADGVVRPLVEGVSGADLPASRPQNHASNLMTLPSGDLACVWFGGTQEGMGDISVWFSRLPRGVTTWTAPEQLSNDNERSEQNPVLFPAADDDLWLLYTAQRSGRQDTAEVRRRRSPDEGQTWGPVETLFTPTDDGGAFIRQPIEVLSSGRWILPMFRCPTPGSGRWVGDHDFSTVMLSDDRGETWTEKVVPGSTGLVHMNVKQLPDGTVVALFRSRWADAVYRTTSVDDGQSWAKPAPTKLPNNNSSIQFTTLTDGRLALVFNPTSAADATDRRASLYDEIEGDEVEQGGGEDSGSTPAAAADSIGRTAFWGTPRAPMTLAVSSDAGLTWPVHRVLEDGDGFCMTNNSADRLNRELSYPSIHQSPDGTVHVTYTHFRQVIRYVSCDPGWISDAAVTSTPA